MPPPLFPPLPPTRWRSTRDTLHRWLQILGKVRLAAAPPGRDPWHTSLQVTGRGITTGIVGTDPVFTVDLDLVAHRLQVHTIAGTTTSLQLLGQSVASLYDRLLTVLGDLGVAVTIADPRPVGLDDTTAFADDTAPAAYDPVCAFRSWQVLSEVDLLLERFAGRWSGPTSPVHLRWAPFDLVVTRYSDRVATHLPATDPATREARPREQLRFGFQLGDAAGPDPAFAVLVVPAPARLAAEPLHPPAATWDVEGNGRPAVYRYDDARAAVDPRASVLRFYDSAYRAGARHATWDPARHDAHGDAPPSAAGRSGGRPHGPGRT